MLSGSEPPSCMNLVCAKNVLVDMGEKCIYIYIYKGAYHTSLNHTSEGGGYVLSDT